MGNVDPTTLEDSSVIEVEQEVRPVGYGEFLLSLVPTSAVGAFAEGDVLPVLFFSLMFAFALLALVPRANRSSTPSTHCRRFCSR